MALTNDDLLALSQLLDMKLKPMQEEQKQIHDEIRNLKLVLERDFAPRLQNIESCYTDTFKRYAVGIEQLDALQADVEILKKIIQEHSKKLKEIS